MTEEKMTIRVPLAMKLDIEILSANAKCSCSEIIRRSLTNTLEPIINKIQFLDAEQGKRIELQNQEIFSLLSEISVELHRIGINYNQQIKLMNSEKRFRKNNDVQALINDYDSIINECKDFNIEDLQTLLDKFNDIREEVSELMYTRVTCAKDGAAAIKYARDGKGHNGGERNVLIGSVGLVDNSIPYEIQMANDWVRARKNHKTQVIRIIASASVNELDPQDENAPYTLMEICQTFIRENFKGHTAAIFIQNDGVGYGPGTLDNAGNPSGGKLHAHMIINDVNSITGKGIENFKKHFKFVVEKFDEVAQRFIPLDPGTPTKQKMSQVERVFTAENQQAIEEGKLPKHDIWIQYMRQQITIALHNSISQRDFIENLKECGIEATISDPRIKATGKETVGSITYELVDVPEEILETTTKTNFKVRGSKLGADFDYENIMATIKKNIEPAINLYPMAEVSNEVSLIVKPNKVGVFTKPLNINSINDTPDFESSVSWVLKHIPHAKSIFYNRTVSGAPTPQFRAAINIITKKTSSGNSSTTDGGLGKSHKNPAFEKLLIQRESIDKYHASHPTTDFEIER